LVNGRLRECQELDEIFFPETSTNE
jgi:hypothetical protein